MEEPKQSNPIGAKKSAAAETKSSHAADTGRKKGKGPNPVQSDSGADAPDNALESVQIISLEKGKSIEKSKSMETIPHNNGVPAVAGTAAGAGPATVAGTAGVAAVAAVKEVVEVAEPETQAVPEIPAFDREKWKPKTGIGKKIKAGEITSLDQILDQGHKILEAEIVDALIPHLETELLFIGQSKGKFGGGQRRVFKQTQKKTAEGNKPHFAASCIVGNKDGFIGIGYGKSKETVPGREKAIRNAKLHIMKIRRGCGSWQCGCRQPHSIPFEIEGRCGSCRIKLMPAPRGTGLKVERECGKVLGIAGIKDIWSITKGQTRTKTNLVMACIEALKKLISTKTQPDMERELGMVEGKSKEAAEVSHE